MAMTDKMRDILESRTPPGGIVKGRFEPFKSHVDGSIITNSAELKKHNERNNVINVREWGNDSYCDLSAKKTREEDYLAESPRHVKQRKEDIAKAIQKCEQGYVPTKIEEGE